MRLNGFWTTTELYGAEKLNMLGFRYKYLLLCCESVQSILGFGPLTGFDDYKKTMSVQRSPCSLKKV